METVSFKAFIKKACANSILFSLSEQLQYTRLARYHMKYRVNDLMSLKVTN